MDIRSCLLINIFGLLHNEDFIAFISVDFIHQMSLLTAICLSSGQASAHSDQSYILSCDLSG